MSGAQLSRRSIVTALSCLALSCRRSIVGAQLSGAQWSVNLLHRDKRITLCRPANGEPGLGTNTSIFIGQHILQKICQIYLRHQTLFLTPKELPISPGYDENCGLSSGELSVIRLDIRRKKNDRKR
uniref:Uncharacterized protein n=1 Tax=Romanomermis culicivorax TaxID=13658 RepID=A0A915IYC1_ROMCU